jgi:hypothetical protein
MDKFGTMVDELRRRMENSGIDEDPMEVLDALSNRLAEIVLILAADYMGRYPEVPDGDPT